VSRRENFVTKSKMPWQVKATPLADYYAEIGDTAYGKSGNYREKVSLGSFPIGMHEQLRIELLNSNTVFESPYWGGEDLKLRQIISA
jgi:outer membrane lipoprotein-sorting protein